MIRVYCQYSVSGFKIFHLNNLPHQVGSNKYVKMHEVNSAVHGEKQDFVITGTSGCDLDIRIMRLFSINGISLLYLNNVGNEKNEYALYLNEPAKKMSYAFVSDEESGIAILLNLASLWLSKDKNEIINRLQKVACMLVIDDEPVFAFQENEWQGLIEYVSKSIIPADFKAITGKGKNNILSYFALDKGSILRQAGINANACTFAMIPANEKIAELEKRKRIFKYTAMGVLSIFSAGVIAYLISRCK